MLKLRIRDTDRVVDCDVVGKIGSHKSCGLRILDDPAVANIHAVVEVTSLGAELLDLGTLYGTYVNGKRITGGWDLEQGDEILVGSTTILVEAFDPVVDGGPADAGVPCEVCSLSEGCGDGGEPEPTGNRIALKYGDLELVVLEVTEEHLKLYANGRGNFLPLDGEKLSGLARSLMAAGFALSPAGALLPRSFDDLRSKVEEFKTPSTPSGRFARTMLTGIATFAQEQFKAAGVDLNPEPDDEEEDEA
jgi:pSer/pThr/pTyr-binding forkhead associated (FHA) protein